MPISNGTITIIRYHTISYLLATMALSVIPLTIDSLNEILKKQLVSDTDKCAVVKMKPMIVHDMSFPNVGINDTGLYNSALANHGCNNADVENIIS